jgi:hypothetical protein
MRLQSGGMGAIRAAPVNGRVADVTASARSLPSLIGGSAGLTTKMKGDFA